MWSFISISVCQHFRFAVTQYIYIIIIIIKEEISNVIYGQAVRGIHCSFYCSARTVAVQPLRPGKDTISKSFNKLYYIITIFKQYFPDFYLFIYFLQIAAQMGRALLDFVWAVRYHVDQ